MRRCSGWSLASSLTLLLAPAAFGATVLERKVIHTIEGDGSLRTVEVHRVRLDSRADVERWSTYEVVFNENDTLDKVQARAVKPDGEEIVVKRDEHDTQGLVGQSELHSSRKLHVAPFPPLPIGSIVDVGHEIKTAPYFPAEQLALRGGDRVERLSVEIRGAPRGFRWRIDGPVDGLKIEETGSGLKIEGSDLPAIDPPSLAPERAPTFPVLRYAWGEQASWVDVGEWYSRLAGDLPRADPSVREEARRLTAGVDDPWDRLNLLLAFCQRQVRYVAVEVGIGGYRPTPPPDTLQRKWGDCKDKSFLLLDLLDGAEIEAYPALILGSFSDRVDADFPTPFAFNHMIVAVPAAEWMQGDDLPIAGGYLFVDPTQTRGRARWLSGWTQGQHALVVREQGSELVQTPIVERAESRDLEVELMVAADGNAAGNARLAFQGAAAAAWYERLATAPPARTEESLRDLFDDLFPGAAIETVTWDGLDSDIPQVTLTAHLRLEGMLAGAEGRRSFRVGGLSYTPQLRLFGDREQPIVLQPATFSARWSLRVPSGWCMPEDRVDEVHTEIGSFHQAIASEPGRIRVERRTTLRERWVEKDRFDALKELSLAEHRATKRRIRLRCSE